MERSSINIFSKPEEIDAVIKSKLAQFSTKGGKQKNSLVKWTDEEIDLRDSVVIDYLTVNCLSREQTARQLCDRWDISIGTARKYVNEAVIHFCNNVVEEDAVIRKKMFEEKLNSILQDAVDNDDRQSALRALDIFAKTTGMYDNKTDVNLTVDGGISFEFGGE